MQAASFECTPSVHFSILVPIGKVVPVLKYLTPHHEDVCGSGSIAAAFFTAALCGCEWSALWPSDVTLMERSAGTR
jgi:hypothetical protein